MGPVTYTAATATTKATLDFTVISTDLAGVGVGEYVTITCLLNGTAPPTSEFKSTPSFSPEDMSFAPLAHPDSKLTSTIN